MVTVSFGLSFTFQEPSLQYHKQSRKKDLINRVNTVFREQQACSFEARLPDSLPSVFPSPSQTAKRHSSSTVYRFVPVDGSRFRTNIPYMPVLCWVRTVGGNRYIKHHAKQWRKNTCRLTTPYFLKAPELMI